MRAVSPYITAYNDAAHATTGNAAAKRAAGEAAVMKALNDSINVTSSWSEVVKDSAAAQKSSTSIAISAWEKFAGTIGAAVEPALMTLGTDLSIVTMATKPVAESLADLVDTFTQVSTAIQSLPGFAGPEMDAAQKGKNDKELADLDALGKRGPLSARQTLRKHMLEDQNIEISQKLPQSEPGMVHPNYAKQSEMAAADLKNNVNGGSIWDHIKSAASVGFGTSNGSVASSVLTGGGAGAVRSLGTLAKSYNDAKESGALTAAANKLSAAADKLAVIGNPIGSVHDWILK